MEWESGFRPRDWRLQPPALYPDYRTSVARSPGRPLVRLPTGLTEMTGPVFQAGDVDALEADLLRNGRVDADPIGERILIHGRILDEDGRPVRAGLVEMWQANAAGRYRHVNDSYMAPVDPNFTGGGRCLTDADGRYRFMTVRPGPYPWPNGPNTWRPAHVHFSLFGDAFAQRLVTQMYFECDPLLPLCPIFNSVPDAPARERLVARLDMDAAKPFDHLAYRFDMVLRGRNATVFENRLEG